MLSAFICSSLTAFLLFLALAVFGESFLRYVSNYKPQIKNRLQKNSGFTLVEILVVLLILSILSSIAVPTLLNERYRGYLATAVSDANTVSQEIASVLADYTSLGTNAGTITIAGGVLVFSPMVSATGIGNVVATGPGTTTTLVNISSNSTIGTANWGTSGGVNWCVEIINKNTFTKYTSNGPDVEGIGSAPSGSQLCVAGA